MGRKATPLEIEQALDSDGETRSLQSRLEKVQGLVESYESREVPLHLRQARGTQAEHQFRVAHDCTPAMQLASRAGNFSRRKC